MSTPPLANMERAPSTFTASKSNPPSPEVLAAIRAQGRAYLAHTATQGPFDAQFDTASLVAELPTTVHVGECLPRPVWIGHGDPPHITGAHHYYRTLAPARMSGGHALTHLWWNPSAMAGDGRCYQTRAEYLIDLPAALTLYRVGTPTIVNLHGQFLRGWRDGPTRGMLDVIRALVASGHPVYIGLDDDILDPMPSAQAWVQSDLVLCTMTPAAVAEFDIELRHCQLILQAAFRAATGAIVSTPAVARAVAPYAATVLLVPNVLDPADFAPMPRQDDTVLRISCAGSPVHNGADLALVLPALMSCAQRPHVELHFWGAHPRYRDNITSAAVLDYAGIQYHYHPLEPDFRTFHRATSRMDIAIAPLADNPFNRAKSACKWLENGLSGIPIVVSGLPPYAPATHGVTALKAKTAEDWYRYLRLLIDSPDTRQRIGRAAQAEVLRNHTPEAVGPSVRRMFAELAQTPYVQ